MWGELSFERWGSGRGGGKGWVMYALLVCLAGKCNFGKKIQLHYVCNRPALWSVTNLCKVPMLAC